MRKTSSLSFPIPEYASFIILIRFKDLLIIWISSSLKLNGTRHDSLVPLLLHYLQYFGDETALGRGMFLFSLVGWALWCKLRSLLQAHNLITPESHLVGQVSPRRKIKWVFPSSLCCSESLITRTTASPRSSTGQSVSILSANQTDWR